MTARRPRVVDFSRLAACVRPVDRLAGGDYAAAAPPTAFAAPVSVWSTYLALHGHWSGVMRLEGSCHCKRVRFSLRSATPVPFMECYCSICRKTAGGGGFAINIGGDARSLKVEGKEHTRIYHARLEDEAGNATESASERHFCGVCGSALWLWDKNWPNLVHPLASAIDTPLPVAPERVRLMLAHKASWVEVAKEGGPRYQGYPSESLQQWHERHGLLSTD